MKTKLILGCCIVYILAACSEDDFSEPLSVDKNWFVIQDDPNDELQHLTYEVYKNTGIPIFYNDTIGREERGTDAYGNPIIHYEILDPTYTLTSANTYTRYCVPDNRANVKLGIELLRDYVIPEIPAIIHVHSFLLVDSLCHDEYGEGEFGSGFAWLDTYVGMMTTMVGRMESIGRMTPEERKDFATQIVARLISSWLSEHEKEGLKNFYAVSTAASGQGYLPYDQWIYNKTKEACGFLSSPEEVDPGTPYGYFKAPSQEQDLADYLYACLNINEAEFNECYKAFPAIIDKYGMMRKILQKLTAGN